MAGLLSASYLFRRASFLYQARSISTLSLRVTRERSVVYLSPAKLSFSGYLGVSRASLSRPREQPRFTSSRAISTAAPLHSRHKPQASNMVAEDFEAVLKAKYPSKSHAKRVVDLIREKIPDANGILYLESRMTKLLEDNDEPEPFRQRRFFYYLTGCNLPDCYYIYDIQSSKSILFIPPIDPDSVIWSGLPLSIDEALQKYDVDEVKLTSELNATLAHLGRANPQSTAYAIANQVSDHVTFLEFEEKNFDALKEAIEVSRVVKDEFEVAIIRKANYVSDIAHRAVLEKAKTAVNEREFEAAFLERCVAHGAKEMAYHPIAASGRAAATLHYVTNEAPLEGKLNLLMDAGAEWNNYAADITRTFPLSGKFSKESREIYEIVLKMQNDCIAVLKEGVLWDDVHLLAHKIAIDGLLSIGILKGDKDEILKARTSAAFLPHGLGHYLGMDTHDTGGNANYEDKDKLFRYLRVRGNLPSGSVITVEPGIYFCNFIIAPYLEDPVHSKFIDSAVLDKYWDVGGVRIEDNILITKDGSENLTITPKEVDEIETLVSN
ncbi:putative Xaa-Pro aminopeptidase [Fusarium solani]|uniref:Xaa-Pro aminopeptidase n=2 Tax=Fusarium solani TaxID=169388 RepID=A0A9P9L2P1_FUSSL|nr:putative Xaa-Pro aminopeptidase [Fusarium solani]KAH7273119.1 putative Xaa-Pro aminopeptidase [Fusarium solani]